MHHIYNDILHQAAVSWLLYVILGLNMVSFIWCFVGGGILFVELQQNPEEGRWAYVKSLKPTRTGKHKKKVH